jgi:hypothetical protein
MRIRVTMENGMTVEVEVNDTIDRDEDARRCLRVMAQFAPGDHFTDQQRKQFQADIDRLSGTGH